MSPSPAAVPAPTPTSPMVTTTRAAKIIGCSRQWLHKMIQKGLVAAVPMKRDGSARPIWLISEAEARRVKELDLVKRVKV